MEIPPSQPEEENSWEGDFASEQSDAKIERDDVESEQEPLPVWLSPTILRMGRVGAAVLGVLMVLTAGALSLIERDSDAPATDVDPSASVDPLAVPVWRPPFPLVDARPPTIVERQPPAPLPRPDPPAATRPTPRVPSAPPPSPLRSAERSPSAPPRDATDAPPRLATTESAPGPLPRVAVDNPAPTLPAPPSPAAVPTPLTPPSVEANSSPSSASRTAEIDAETGAIHDVLGRYRSALSALDSEAVQQVWPKVNQRTLVRAFGQVQEQDVTFFSCAIDVKAGFAQARCVGTTNFVPKVGKRSSQFGPSQWNVTLRKKRSGAWQIEEVQAR